MATPSYTYAIGRRKTAVAQLRLFTGAGDSTINGLPFDTYVKRPDLFATLFSPLKVASVMGQYHFWVKVEGSGENAQVEAIRHALSRALSEVNPALRKVLKAEGFLTREARVVERKKPGLHKARKASQWSKR